MESWRGDMNCPHCGYEYKVTGIGAKRKQVGDEGTFLELPIMMAREDLMSYRKDERRVYGCPKCSKLFMDRW